MRKDSFDRSKIKTPRDTRALPNLPVPDNFNLKYNRFARYESSRNEDKFKFFHIDKGKNTGNQSFEIQHGNYGNLNWNALCLRQKNAAEQLLSPVKVLTKNHRPHWRWIVGLGGASVYETGIELHHIYGFPYIPASTVKGATRSFVIREVFSNNEDLALQDKDFCAWFGCPEKSVLKKALEGNLVFFDAFPTTAPQLATDIMNPHYSAYYSENKPPADYLSPTPIPFLTVVETTYQFLLGFRKLGAEALLSGKTAADWLEAALKDGGVGAKTAVGYGYFE